jgi:hypothetical protein
MTLTPAQIAVTLLIATIASIGGNFIFQWMADKPWMPWITGKPDWKKAWDSSYAMAVMTAISVGIIYVQSIIHNL